MKIKNSLYRSVIALGIIAAATACSDDLFNPNSNTSENNDRYVRFDIVAPGNEELANGTRVHNAGKDSTMNSTGIYWDNDDELSIYAVGFGDQAATTANASPNIRKFYGDVSATPSIYKISNISNDDVNKKSTAKLIPTDAKGMEWFWTKRDGKLLNHRFFAVYPKVDGSRILSVDFPKREGTTQGDVYYDARGMAVTYQFPAIQYSVINDKYHKIRNINGHDINNNNLTTIDLFTYPADPTLNYMVGVSPETYLPGDKSKDPKLVMRPILTQLNVVVRGDANYPTTVKGLKVKLINGQAYGTFHEQYKATYATQGDVAMSGSSMPTTTTPVTTSATINELSIYFKDANGNSATANIPAGGTIKVSFFVPALKYQFANGAGYSLAITPIKGDDGLTADPQTSYSGTVPIAPTSQSKLTVKALEVSTNKNIPTTDGDMDNWIEKLAPSDNMLIRNFSLPGAHQALARKDNPNYSNMNLQDTKQDIDVTAMLNAGIRVLDLRYTNGESYDYAPAVSFDHNMQNDDDYVLRKKIRAIREWVKAHPSEFVVIIIGRETGEHANATNAYNTVRAIYQELSGQNISKFPLPEYNYDNTDHLANFTPDMTYKDAKGKIIMVVRPVGSTDGDAEQFPGDIDTSYRDLVNDFASVIHTPENLRSVSLNKRHWKQWDSNNNYRFGNTALMTDVTYNLYDGVNYRTPLQTNYNKLAYISNKINNSATTNRGYLTVYDCEVMGAFNDVFKFSNYEVAQSVTKYDLPYLNGYLAANHMLMTQQSPDYWSVTVIPGYIGKGTRNIDNNLYSNSSLGNNQVSEVGTWLNLVPYNSQAILEMIAQRHRPGKFGMVMTDFVPATPFTLSGNTLLDNAHKATATVIKTVIWQNFFDKANGTYQ